jgi:hypothetical protein
VAARIAVAPHESFREQAALQVGAQLVLDVARQPAIVVLAGVGEERFEVLTYEAIQNGLRWTPREVGGSEDGHEAARIADRVPGAGLEIPPVCEAPALSRTARGVAADTRGAEQHERSIRQALVDGT